MPVPKGTRIGGRQKGTPNKVTGQVKDMVLDALAEAGGVKYLRRQADENPTAFMALVGKVMPTQVTGENGDAIRMINEIVLRGVRSDARD